MQFLSIIDRILIKDTYTLHRDIPSSHLADDRLEEGWSSQSPYITRLGRPACEDDGDIAAWRTVYELVLCVTADVLAPPNRGWCRQSDACGSEKIDDELHSQQVSQRSTLSLETHSKSLNGLLICHDLGCAEVVS